MMEVEEQKACDLWVKSVMAEFAGLPDATVPAPSSADGVSLFYDVSEWKAMFRSAVPSIAERIIELATTMRVLWDVWPMLTEAELGTIMQVGASNFLMPAEATP